MIDYIKNRYRNLDWWEKIQVTITMLLRLTLIGAVVFGILFSALSISFFSALIFCITFLPHIFARRIKVHLPVEFEFFIIVFMYLALFLGDLGSYYEKFWWWDLFLHAGSGMAIGFIGFLVLFIMYRKDRIRGNPFVIAVFSFCFALAIGALWEIFEYSMDQIFGLNMQRSGLVDTMEDLIVNSIGALITSTIGYLYLRGKNITLVQRLVNKFMEKNQNLMNEEQNEQNRL